MKSIADGESENLRQLNTTWGNSRGEQQTELSSEARNAVRRTLFVDTPTTTTVESNDNVLTESNNEQNNKWLSYVLERLTDDPKNMPGNSQTPPAKDVKDKEPEVQTASEAESRIKDVWAHNLEEEFSAIRKLLPKYCYVAMDTEFPGVVARPIGDFKTTADYLYQLLRCNVDLLRIIQLGLSFFDEDGKTPTGPYTTWQFNFQFNLSEDMYAQDSIELLTNSR
jgi:CCR4-NOT transcription complex subunit 7/8